MNKTRSIEETIGLLDRLTEAYKKLHRIWDGVETRLERKHQAVIKEGDNLWLPKVLYRGDYYYGILPNGGMNPNDFQQYGNSECK